MDSATHTPKRRRVDDGTPQSTDPSSDELGGNSDLERRRASWARYAQPTPYRSPRKQKIPTEPLSESDSPDELAQDFEVFWRQSQGPRARHPQSRSKSRSKSKSRSRSTSPISRSDADQDIEEADAEDNEDLIDGENQDDESTERGGTATPIPPSPTPPPPPSKPDRLYYKEKFILRGHQRGVSAVQFSPDGSMIASCSADATIKVWNTRSGKLLHTFEGHLAGISTLSWSPDGNKIASGSDDKSIRIWDVLTGKPYPNPLLGHHNYIYSIAFSPKGNMLVSGSYDEAVFLWDVRSARIMRSLPAHSDPVAGVDMVRDGTLLVSCAGDGLIRIWDTATGQCLRTLVHEDNPPVSAVKFSPNGKFVLAWSLDGCIRLWNYVEGRCVKTYQGHKNEKYSISGGFGCYGQPSQHGGSGSGITASAAQKLFTPNTFAFAVSGSEDGAVLCWDVVSKEILQKIEGHTDVVLGVDTFAPADDKRLIVSCGLDRTVRLWEETEGTEEEDEAEKDEEGKEGEKNEEGGSEGERQKAVKEEINEVMNAMDIDGD